MISVSNLNKIYKSPVKTGNLFRDFFKRKYKIQKALENISFSIGEGELVGFIGPNGAGKTTTLKILSGILYPTSGQVEVLGFTPFDKDPNYLKQIGFVMGQRNQLMWELPVVDTFKLNKEIYEISDQQYKKTLSELVELLEAKDFIDKPAKTLSLGQRMRCELIASLIHSPKILFLDEPTIGLDIFAQNTIINFIREYNQLHKATIMLTSHYMKDVEQLAKRLIMIDKGHLLFDNTMGNFIEKFSEDKTIVFILKKPLKETITTVSKRKYKYEFPELRISVKREEITTLLPKLLKEIPYIDVSIEDEPLEELIGKVFEK